jgi:quercetin dioxygenase-like cupin family protein
MPVVHASNAVVHEMHGSRFVSYAASALGSTELCAWRSEIPAGTETPAHSISREEVFLVLTGSVRLTLDGEPHLLSPGDVAVAPAGSTLKFDTLTESAVTIWVTTSIGLEGVFPDGSRVSPPWAR